MHIPSSAGALGCGNETTHYWWNSSRSFSFRYKPYSYPAARASKIGGPMTWSVPYGTLASPSRQMGRNESFSSCDSSCFSLKRTVRQAVQCVDLDGRSDAEGGS